MTTSNHLTAINTAYLTKRMLIGAGIGLILITLLVSSVNHPNPKWGELWMIRPLLIVPLAGAGGGLFTYLIEHLLGYQRTSHKIITVLLSLIGFIMALWLGTVLGLSGTLWN